ncbi:tetratricopeptide repeat protein [Psychroserpens sp.]|uniref:ATP-binding protein n=1 Tax=Psychroserpens sp. TaxID=2020870 RepID=UPI00385983B3
MIRNIIFFFIITSSVYAQKNTSTSVTDSISNLFKLSKDSSKPIKDRFKYADLAVEFSKKSANDSLLIRSKKNLALLYFETENYAEYSQMNRDALLAAIKIGDSTTMASSYHNIGWYHYLNAKNDSAYYYYSKAIKLYKSQKNKKQEATILLGIADIQETEKDYIGSEENAIEAIKLFSLLPKTDDVLGQLWTLNNLLGVISLKLKNYNKALEYHKEALSISKEMNNGHYLSLYSINNEAIVYRMLGDIDKSIELYDQVINEKNLDFDDPSFYALTLGNLAYSKSLKDDLNVQEVEDIFKKAYYISDTLQDPLTKLGVAIDYSRFHQDIGKKESAKSLANQSYKIAKDLSSNDLVLESLIILSELSEGEQAKSYLNEHIKLNDSLLDIERNVHNKFARIEFETDKIEEENERISQQRMWLMIVSAVLLMTLFLLYVIITQRAKNKELQFEKDQQKANEEIYNLMLSQQDKVDEARANEKKRISQEMHDGILGRLFGTRLSLDSLNFSEGKEAIQNRSNYINELKTIEDDIRKISHDLNTDFVSGSGFMDIVSELIEKQTKAYQLKHQFDYTDDVSWESVSNKNKINIYRIIQESLQNIYKHANADEVKISFQLKNNVILLSITDNGDGFDVNKSKKGIGIKNINARVKELEGALDILSQISKGTTINIEIPYKTNP